MDQLNLRSRSGDMTLTLVERKGRITVNLEVDKPLDWGFEEAGLVLEPVDVARLKHWAATGKALPARGPGAPTGEERDEGPVEALARLTWDAQAADGPFGWGDLTEDQRQRWRAAARKTLTGESATAIQAVRELHRPVTAWVDTVIHDGAEEPERRAVYADDGSLVAALDGTESTCGGCRPGTPYPCATVQLLDRLTRPDSRSARTGGFMAERNEWAEDAADLDCPRCATPLDEAEGEVPGALCRACRAAR